MKDLESDPFQQVHTQLTENNNLTKSVRLTEGLKDSDIRNEFDNFIPNEKDSSFSQVDKKKKNLNSD
eukprot:CAMPEP_0116916238 /NCGR_PEP_ID=MMETSP0467-20121206/18406_1 /TAXON_ID=283647 /ORGANISM="Mesodinium pulex, Strain SPMC105" /LENGTH=66 /DNA_ID=CAMNT_0004593057 /DNA_START=253 /DNA_END=453 /DNA_ORIENTATION=+